MIRLSLSTFVLAFILSSFASCDELSQLPADYVAGPLVIVVDNGAWSWFSDPRAIVDHGKLIVSSVRAVSLGSSDPSSAGNIEVATLDLADGSLIHSVLHERLEQDDHDSAALAVLDDGRYLAAYTKHGGDLSLRFRISEPGDATHWHPEIVVNGPGMMPKDRVTYANLFRLANGDLHCFHRGFGLDPNYLVSRNNGQDWQYGGRLVHGRDGYSPYLKYASDGNGRIHFVATEDHPRHFDNSLYHGYLENGWLHRSDGTRIAKLSTSTEANANVWDCTQIFASDPDHVAWMSDIEVDIDGHPYVAFSTQRDGRSLPGGQGGMDLRYHLARFNGAKWHESEIAHAGTRLYQGEDDYSGLVALDPRNPDVLYISTNAEPTTGEPLVSHADGQRHYEIFRGECYDKVWRWTPVTANSTVDNIRPIMPKVADGPAPLVWLRGQYKTYRQWTTAVVALVAPN